MEGATKSHIEASSNNGGNQIQRTISIPRSDYYLYASSQSFWRKDTNEEQEQEQGQMKKRVYKAKNVKVMDSAVSAGCSCRAGISSYRKNKLTSFGDFMSSKASILGRKKVVEHKPKKQDQGLQVYMDTSNVNKTTCQGKCCDFHFDCKLSDKEGLELTFGGLQLAKNDDKEDEVSLLSGECSNFSSAAEHGLVMDMNTKLRFSDLGASAASLTKRSDAFQSHAQAQARIQEMMVLERDKNDVEGYLDFINGRVNDDNFARQQYGIVAGQKGCYPFGGAKLDHPSKHDSSIRGMEKKLADVNSSAMESLGNMVCNKNNSSIECMEKNLANIKHDATSLKCVDKNLEKVNSSKHDVVVKNLANVISSKQGTKKLVDRNVGFGRKTSNANGYHDVSPNMKKNISSNNSPKRPAASSRIPSLNSGLKREPKNSPVKTLDYNDQQKRISENKLMVGHQRQEDSRVNEESEGKVFDSFAMVKSSYDPIKDFRDSMVEMIVDNNISDPVGLQELLNCYISLNSQEYHSLIVDVFKEVQSQLLHILPLSK